MSALGWCRRDRRKKWVNCPTPSNFSPLQNVLFAGIFSLKYEVLGANAPHFGKIMSKLKFLTPIRLYVFII